LSSAGFQRVGVATEQWEGRVVVSIDVRSAAGRFDVEIEKITVDGDKILLGGTMDGLDCTSVISGSDALRLARLGMHTQVVGCLLRALLRPGQRPPR
jgi:hypothetical protein